MKSIGLFRIGKDAELRTVGQDCVVSLALAYNYGKKGEDGKRPTQWLEGSLWGKRAESLAQYLVKGQQVMVDLSEVHTETFEGKNGTGSKLVGRINDIEFAGSAPDRASAPQAPRQAPPQAQRSVAPTQQRQPQQNNGGGRQSGGFDDFESDVPF